MFIIDPTANTLQAIPQRTFSDLGFQERKHLQEWIAGNPECLGEKLLIIQKEFSGFSETNERLDLLALDKSGNLVIIENKLDDSGRDVTWQALKYASYCSTLKKEDIKSMFESYLKSKGEGLSAEDRILEFLQETDFSELLLNQRMQQRIILVAAHFRKEVTSTVLWLMNFKVQLQCFKATPFLWQGQHFLTLEQIIPTKDAQDYVISMANKSQEELTITDETKNRHRIRLKFWKKFLNDIKGKSPLFQSSNPTKEYTLSAGGTGITYVTYQVVISGGESIARLNFGRVSKEENKALFDALSQHREKIDSAFGADLSWEREDALKKSAVSYHKLGQNYFNESDWPEISEFLIDHITRLHHAVSPYVPYLKSTLAHIVGHEVDEESEESAEETQEPESIS